MNSLIISIITIINILFYLKQSIVSMINQTYKYLEIILSDDSSTDNHRKIFDVYIEG